MNDNFFELGGHSLLAAKVFAELQRTVTVELNLVDIFNAPTVAGLANLIYEREAQHQESDELMSLLAELDDLSDEEAHQQMTKERATISPARAFASKVVKASPPPGIATRRVDRK
jgi:hypothetical protein